MLIVYIDGLQCDNSIYVYVMYSDQTRVITTWVSLHISLLYIDSLKPLPSGSL